MMKFLKSTAKKFSVCQNPECSKIPAKTQGKSKCVPEKDMASDSEKDVPRQCNHEMCQKAEDLLVPKFMGWKWVSIRFENPLGIVYPE
jgi:hypothetical protein